MSKIQLNNWQKRKLWALFAQASQGAYGVLYDEDHEFDEEMDAYIKKIEDVLNSDYRGEWAAPTDKKGAKDD